MQEPAPPLRILARCHVLKPGGAPNMLAALLRALGRRHQVELARLEDATPSMIASYEAAGFTFTAGTRYSYRHYDVFLANTLLSSEPVIRAAKHIPVLWWIHEAAVGLKFIERGLVDTRAFSAATRIVFPGPRQPRDVYGPFLSESSWTVVPAAIPPIEGLERQRAEDGRYRVLQVGAVARIKGQNVTLRALGVLDDPSLDLRFVGDDDTDWANALRKELGTRADLQARVTWLGEQPQNESLREIADADVLVYPRKVTSFPLAVLEAMTLGVPVIAVDCPALSDALIDGEDALLMPDGDAKALAQAVKRLRHEPGLAQRLVRNARERIVAKRSYAAFVDAMEAELYRAVEIFRANSGSRQHPQPKAAKSLNEAVSHD